MHEPYQEILLTAMNPLLRQLRDVIASVGRFGSRNWSIEQSLPSTFTSLVSEGRVCRSKPEDAWPFSQTLRRILNLLSCQANVKIKIEMLLYRIRCHQRWTRIIPRVINRKQLKLHTTDFWPIRRFLNILMNFFPKRVKRLTTLEIASPMGVLLGTIFPFEWFLSVLTVNHPNIKRKISNERFDAVKMQEVSSEEIMKLFGMLILMKRFTFPRNHDLGMRLCQSTYQARALETSFPAGGMSWFSQTLASLTLKKARKGR